MVTLVKVGDCKTSYSPFLLRVSVLSFSFFRRSNWHPPGLNTKADIHIALIF